MGRFFRTYYSKHIAVIVNQACCEKRYSFDSFNNEGSILLPHFADEEMEAQGHRTKWQNLNLNPGESGCRVYALSHYV